MRICTYGTLEEIKELKIETIIPVPSSPVKAVMIIGTQSLLSCCDTLGCDMPLLAHNTSAWKSKFRHRILYYIHHNLAYNFVLGNLLPLVPLCIF